jgi:hypothetical protein
MGLNKAGAESIREKLMLCSEQVGQEVTFQTCTREVLGSNVSRGTVYRAWEF